MRSIKSLAALTGAALWIGAGIGLAVAGSDNPQPSVWEHHQVSTSYFGQTSAFTCSGIEEAVKRVLTYLGARPDLQVEASCPDPVRPVTNAVVKADFYTLVPAPSGASDTVSAQWVPIELVPQRPLSMGQNEECELIEQLKDLLTKDFSFRDLQYRALCFPHDVSLQDFRVKAQVLKVEAHQ